MTAAAAAAAPDSAPARDVWAFDFDGVVCDSVGESAISAWEVRKEEGDCSISLFFCPKLNLKKKKTS